MFIEVKFGILNAVRMKPQGVRALVDSAPIRNRKALLLIRTMEAQGLVASEEIRTTRRGRPLKAVSITPLGQEFLKVYERLNIIPRRSTNDDLRRAKEKAAYVTRLVSRGKDPFRAFMELNSIVRDHGDAT